MMSDPSPKQPTIFLSHASEDKPRVLQIYTRLATDLPSVSGWLDIFEITGGDSLIDKIAEGMDQADKFFIFLSPTSVLKPWVRAELKRALNHEIAGIKPGYIVPVKFGDLSVVPPFLEDKLYIDLDQLTAAEWVSAFEAAILGKVGDKTVHPRNNLTVTLLENPDAGRRHIGQIAFTASSWAEDIGFQATTRVEAKEVNYSHDGPNAIKGGAVPFAKMLRSNRVGYTLPGRRLSPGQIFRLTVTFPEGTDFKSSITNVAPWDGTQSTVSGMTF